MALMRLATDNPNLTYYDYRDQQYYGKYQYRLRLKFIGLRFAWYGDIEEIKERLDNKKPYFKFRDLEREHIRNNLPLIQSFIDLRKKYNKEKDITIRTESNTAAIFHNDLNFLKSFEPLFPGAEFDYSQVITSGLVGVKTFKRDPKHNYRVYFRSRRIPEEFKKDLREVLERNESSMTLSYALKKWIQADNTRSWWVDTYMSSNYFIDYDEESILSYLSLMYGDYLGKRYKLEKRTDID